MENLYPLLRGVSRSFYLTLRVLPKKLRPQISVAYLLARASDTVADTQVVPRKRRMELLKEMREGRLKSVREIAGDQALPAERELLERLDEVAALKDGFSEADRALIEKLHDTIVSGQMFDLERFPGEDSGELAALADDAELDRYTFLVAGCVGEFWTRICAANLPELKGWDVEEVSALGIRFGKGLQLVNVLRDIPRDLRIGRCYLPVKDPRPLLNAEAFESLRDEYSRWLDAAVGHLDEGWRYTLSIPSSLWRLRLACIWPIWLGLKTIALLRRGNPLDPGRVIMVPQMETNWMLLKSTVISRSARLLDRVHGRIRRRAMSSG